MLFCCLIEQERLFSNINHVEPKIQKLNSFWKWEIMATTNSRGERNENGVTIDDVAEFEVQSGVAALEWTVR